MRTHADLVLSELIQQTIIFGEKIETRNHEVIRNFSLPSALFSEPPLVTCKKTAWKTALREWEWFMSGNPKCPDELLKWWDGQLGYENNYFDGYGDQLRSFYSLDYIYNGIFEFDQIEHLIHGIIEHPYSRRHVITAWNPYGMSVITLINKNEKTPTTCHTTVAQFFVDKQNKLHMKSYARSQDLLLGTPHNWIQSWAFLVWLAYKTKTEVGTLEWIFGDAHIYNDENHLKVAKAIIDEMDIEVNDNIIKMAYKNNGNDNFIASDFELTGHEKLKPIESIKDIKLKIF